MRCNLLSEDNAREVAVGMKDAMIGGGEIRVYKRYAGGAELYGNLVYDRKDHAFEMSVLL